MDVNFRTLFTPQLPPFAGTVIHKWKGLRHPGLRLHQQEGMDEVGILRMPRRTRTRKDLACSRHKERLNVRGDRSVAPIGHHTVHTCINTLHGASCKEAWFYMPVNNKKNVFKNAHKTPRLATGPVEPSTALVMAKSESTAGSQSLPRRRPLSSALPSRRPIKFSSPLKNALSGHLFMCGKCIKNL